MAEPLAIGRIGETRLVASSLLFERTSQPSPDLPPEGAAGAGNPASRLSPRRLNGGSQLLESTGQVLYPQRTSTRHGGVDRMLSAKLQPCGSGCKGRCRPSASLRVAANARMSLAAQVLGRRASTCFSIVLEHGSDRRWT